MRRILLLLVVVALFLVMVAMSVGPAFAAAWNPDTGCKGTDTRFFYLGSGLGYGRIDKNADGYVCVTGSPQGKQAYDNRL